VFDSPTGTNYERLVELKTKYDPDKPLLQLNQNTRRRV
jgi:hypothetical protein